MKAVVLYGPKDVKIGDLPILPLRAGEIRVKVAYCGICGSDFHKVAGKKNTRPIQYPVALGHEISGVIAEIGPEVTDFQVGDRVTVDPNWSCGHCDACKSGKRSLCSNSRGVVKGMAEYVVAPQENVYRLPENLNLQSAALAEPVSCCLRGLDLLDMRAGDRVALIGLGAIGAIMLCLLRHAGAGEIIVIEYNEERRRLAMELGATVFFPSSDLQAIQAYAESHSIDRVIECVGNASAQETALNIAGRGATVVMFGVSDAAQKLPISLYEAFIKELTIRTSYINPCTTLRALRLLASGAIDTERVIAKVISAEEAVEEFQTPNYSRLGKVLVQMDQNL